LPREVEFPSMVTFSLQLDTTLSSMVWLDLLRVEY